MELDAKPQETNEQQPEQTEQTQEEPQKAKGEPDAQRAAERYRQQRDDARKMAEELQEQISLLQNENAKIAELKQQLEQERSEVERKLKRSEYERLNSGALIKEGCLDVDVALTLLSDEVDVATLKEKKPYLFARESGKTGLQPNGSTPTDSERRTKLAREAAGLV